MFRLLIKAGIPFFIPTAALLLAGTAFLFWGSPLSNSTRFIAFAIFGFLGLCALCLKFYMPDPTGSILFARNGFRGLKLHLLADGKKFIGSRKVFETAIRTAIELGATSVVMDSPLLADSQSSNTTTKLINRTLKQQGIDRTVTVSPVHAWSIVESAGFEPYLKYYGQPGTLPLLRNNRYSLLSRTIVIEFLDT
ncbi:putative protein OS=Eoetvoesiella caeni OX=645616 GN=DFR37_1266 PE=4 SV=1 [Eoetvoesiella caeni]|uniref:Uncharacterized protein n=2 Tax=Eoetvoesiella caeni TaxID=645616 RepID=A0A366GXZ6_9BURK|nr:hypothetical protein DFR37_1266 [Eoetvoesiella caeni]